MKDSFFNSIKVLPRVTITCAVPKELKERFRALCEREGTNVNRVLTKMITELLEEHS